MNTRSKLALNPGNIIFSQHTVGFDTLSKFFNNDKPKPNFPPYDVLKTENDYLITVALAGYDADDIAVSVDNSVLTIQSNGVENPALQHHESMIHQGIATRSFDLQFAIGENIKVESSKMIKGMLSIRLNYVPPADTTTRIPISTE